jgi:hypothetical protein
MRPQMPHSSFFFAGREFRIREAVAVPRPATCDPRKGPPKLFDSRVALPPHISYIAGMVWRSSRGRPVNAPAVFIHPCQPTVAKQPPAGPGWAHCVKPHYEIVRETSGLAANCVRIGRDSFLSRILRFFVARLAEGLAMTRCVCGGLLVNRIKPTSD